MDKETKQPSKINKYIHSNKIITKIWVRTQNGACVTHTYKEKLKNKNI